MSFPKGTKLDRQELEKRRQRAGKLLERGVWPAEVARRVGVHRQSVSRWALMLKRNGPGALKRADRAGRIPRLDREAIQRLEAGLRAGAESIGYDTPLWTAKRVACLIEKQAGVRYHPDHVYRILQRLGWSCQRPVGRALERDEWKIRRWKRKTWPDIKKKRSVKDV